jgi:hypothetical protein
METNFRTVHGWPLSKADRTLCESAPELYHELESAVRLLACYSRREREAGRVSQAEAIQRHIERKAAAMRRALPAVN